MKLTEKRDMPTVYEPAEDSRLLASAAADRITDERVLEVGVGSGYVAQRIAAETAADVVGCDINPEACANARAEGIEVVRSNLTDPFVANSFDVVVFNPPYLPTPPEQEWDDPLEYALSGGEDGRRVIRPFLADLGRILRSDGRGFMLISSLTNVNAVSALAEDAGLDLAEILDESFPYERLIVCEITHANR